MPNAVGTVTCLGLGQMGAALARENGGAIIPH